MDGNIDDRSIWISNKPVYKKKMGQEKAFLKKVIVTVYCKYFIQIYSYKF